MLNVVPKIWLRVALRKMFIFQGVVNGGVTGLFLDLLGLRRIGVTFDLQV